MGRTICKGEAEVNVTNYFTIPGGILAQSIVGGARRTFGRDALGSVVSTFDSNGLIENTYSYLPYGKAMSQI